MLDNRVMLAMPPRQPEIFISYAGADETHAVALAGALGPRAFVDTQLIPGDDAISTVEAAIDAARMVVVLIGQNGQSEDEWWTRTQVARAIRRYQANSKAIRIVPAFIGPHYEGMMPFGLERLTPLHEVAADWEKTARSLLAALDGKRAADGAPMVTPTSSGSWPPRVNALLRGRDVGWAKVDTVGVDRGVHAQSVIDTGGESKPAPTSRQPRVEPPATPSGRRRVSSGGTAPEQPADWLWPPYLEHDEVDDLVDIAMASGLFDHAEFLWRSPLSRELRATLNTASNSAQTFRSDLDALAVIPSFGPGPHPLVVLLSRAGRIVHPRLEAREFKCWANEVRKRVLGYQARLKRQPGRARSRAEGRDGFSDEAPAGSEDNPDVAQENADASEGVTDASEVPAEPSEEAADPSLEAADPSEAVDASEEAAEPSEETVDPSEGTVDPSEGAAGAPEETADAQEDEGGGAGQVDFDIHGDGGLDLGHRALARMLRRTFLVVVLLVVLAATLWAMRFAQV